MERGDWQISISGRGPIHEGTGYDADSEMTDIMECLRKVHTLYAAKLNTPAGEFDYLTNPPEPLRPPDTMKAPASPKPTQTKAEDKPPEKDPEHLPPNPSKPKSKSYAD